MDRNTDKFVTCEVHIKKAPWYLTVTFWVKHLLRLAGQQASKYVREVSTVADSSE